jgi:hypothetical protein
MRRKNDAALLKRIAGIRDLQRSAAEAQAARAGAALREKQGVRDACELQRQAAQDGWAASLSAPPLQMETAALWSAVLLREDRGVRRAATDVDAATADLERRTAGWHAATNRRDAAQDMADAAMKDKIRHREEIALQDASDRHVQRWSGR